jgi:uncharacterized membrane protein YgcG
MNDVPVPPPPPSGFPDSQPPFSPAQYSAPPSGSNRKLVKIIVGVVAGIALLVILFVGAIFAFVFTLVKSAEPYQHAIQVVASDARAQQKLGSRIEARWWSSGSINTSGSSGSADLAIPVRGSSGSGTVYVAAKKSAGQWNYEKLELEIDGQQERVDFLPTKDW